MNPEHRRVVVGVSSFDSRLGMVRWAAEEAAARGAELRLVTAVPRHTDMDQYLPNDPAHALREQARQRLARAADHAASCRPELWISTEQVEGSPTEVLLDAAMNADLLVVGADDQSPFTEAVIGSVPGALVTTAPCPLAVVPQAEVTGGADTPVVAALDEYGTAQAAIAYAFAAADRSKRPLAVLRCLPDGCRDEAPSAEQVRTVRGVGALHPEVDVTQEVAHGDPREVLVSRSRHAALLVLGSRGRGRLASTVFGSLSRTLVRRSRCPVVVARPSRRHEAAACD